MENFCLEISNDNDVSPEYIIFILSSSFPIPDTQAEQISMILNNKKKIHLFSDHSKDKLDMYAESLNKVNIKSKVVSKY